MYVPQAFAVADQEALRQLIADYQFATLISQTKDGLLATHVPVLYEPERRVLAAHVARGNPHAAALDGGDVLVIFQGPHGYISPSWYATHPAVPTWNYTAVHVYGRARLVDDAQSLRAHVGHMVARNEAGRPSPWTMDGLPGPWVEGMIKDIVGVEIEVTRIEGKHKLSQNRSRVDRAKVIEALKTSEHAHERELGAYMAQHAPPP